jgi:hypothetical protein
MFHEQAVGEPACGQTEPPTLHLPILNKPLTCPANPLISITPNNVPSWDIVQKTPHNCPFRCRRKILPLAVFGIVSTNRTADSCL